MDEAIQRSRARALLASIDKTFGDEGKEVDKLLIALRAAYADGQWDGMERAAKTGEVIANLLYSASPAHRKGAQTVIDAIRQAAGEVGK